ncbi:MAG: gamma-glutamyl-gamma-aminobutyrate hydrolase family protein [Arenicellales bacterium]|nr:gamma-glutamyl-gamma-aminobutyrate hydrolase family protein [Arenicellales bacterium]MDP6552816.1 gamma-glutamyl-gamma-aminobutyrate hydrolase family protein [Arenicellales bacterium]MDP6792108.1 gamma-glutamyl-gamma-aminobutyrate hydrolase family protein [Arenicellales bacterium]MDP6919908.1 gamma-glutamyl-gamma-aminobutyrate hydrolase family protein [Arenicellales bacterium]|tara:strand:- start:2717 stop:3427 length:711 start_codon:yes stop_codon:yes gene_type:complete
MRRKILVIEHHDEPRDDLASLYLPELGFVPEWYRPFAGEALPELDEDTAGAVVLGGAPNVDQMDQYPYLRDESRWIEQCLKQDIPILGLCLGAQLLAHVLGASVAPHTEGAEEFGLYPVAPVEPGSAFVPDHFFAVQFHSRGFEIPKGAEALAVGDLFPNQAFRYGAQVLGTQFHPECTLAILRRWQALTAAPWQQPGVQSKAEQDRLAAKHLDNAQHWFEQLLGDFFASPPSSSA